jgi:hypothetical protein
MPMGHAHAAKRTKDGRVEVIFIFLGLWGLITAIIHGAVSKRAARRASLKLGSLGRPYRDVRSIVKGTFGRRLMRRGVRGYTRRWR